MIKKLLIFLLSLVLIVVLGVGALISFVDPNDFKPLISREVKNVTGRDLNINGDISWSFWPNVGLSITKVGLSNPEGFAEKNLLQFNEASLSVAVTPLMSKTLQINKVTLLDARFFMQTLADGRNNLAGLTSSSAEKPEQNQEVSEKPATGSKSDWVVKLEGLEIQNASALTI